jgi:hypothetical protein
MQPNESPPQRSACTFDIAVMAFTALYIRDEFGKRTSSASV